VSGSVLWYVHDHGLGHLQRARAVVDLLAAPVVVAAGPGVADAAAAALDVPVVALPPDAEGGVAVPRGPWHHAPAGRMTRDRQLALIETIADHDCTTAVVDVSMEVTALASLLGLRTIAVRQSGHRGDVAHRVGLSCADVVWVPQHRALEPVDDGTDERWCFTGAFSRFDGLGSTAADDDPRVVLFVLGAGGTTFDEAAFRDAVAPPGWRVVIAGGPTAWAHGDVSAVGRTDALLPLLRAATVVVTSAGWASTADVAAVGRALVVVPEDRPFDEQAVRAAALGAAGLATSVGRWPSPDELPGVLAAATALDPQRWSTVHDGRGAARAAAMIERIHAA
jgi:UDP-N-acetylglucosamine:LPS N-acetylglucosamine transferase